jgi:hypothetical protein
MPNPVGYNGRGTILQYSVDGQTWVLVPQIQQFEPAGSKQTMVDQTNLSTPGNFTQPQAVQVDSGEIEFSGIYAPLSGQLLLGQYHGALTLLFWQAQLTDGSYYTFQAYVSEFKPFGVKVNKLNTWSGKLRLVGGMESPLSAFEPAAFDPHAFQVVEI